MKSKIYYCNKCNKGLKDLNGNEEEEMQNSLKTDGVPSFVCSECINEEMERE